MKERFEVFDSPGKGRGIRATTKIMPGSVILKVLPYSYIVKEEMAHCVCHYTLNLAIPKAPGEQPPNYSKCSNCKFARYESKQAQKDDWKDHKEECKAMVRVAPKKFNNETRLVAKMLNKLKRFEGKSCPEEKYHKVMDMEDHMDQRTPEDRVSIDENVMNFGDYVGYENLPESDDILYHLFGTIECNAFSITDARGVTIVGVGIYPVISLLNTSMDPNCVSISIGKQVWVRALKEIQAGEELLINYCDEMCTIEQAKEQYKQGYYFEYDIESESLESQEFIKKKESALTAFKPELEEAPSEKQIEYITRYSKDMLRRATKEVTKGNHPRYTMICTGALMQQENLLADTNIMKISLLRLAADGYAAQRNYEEALIYSQRVLTAFKSYLPPHSAALAMYNLKVGTLHWHLQHIDEAIKTLADAVHGLEITHGEEHQMTKDCLEMIKQCQQEAQLDKFSRAKIRAARQQMGQNKAVDINEALKNQD